eukprot:9378261-Pyramimonas_sp.AAC.1
MVTWREVWQHHGYDLPDRPADFTSWPNLPAISVPDLRAASLSFLERTAVGQTGIAPRALWH